MNQYQKVYMNQIHSSSLLGQLAQMWRSQMLCDALIRTGNITTKAHRVVLVAACPMLQSMDNASVGSHLEVRLAADIKQEAVNSFLQYLYEGFMMLTEDNCKDVEKVARLLQVDSVTKCCIDFYSCLQKKTGAQVYSNTQYKYSSADLLEFRHVRTTDLQKTVQERMMKRAAADSMRPMSPSGKRQRMQQQQRPLSPNIDLAMFGQKADDTLSMAHSYMGNIGNQASDPWERVPRIGGVHNQRPQPKPGVIEIVEDSLEILQTQPPDKDGNKSAPPVIQKSLAISVSSQVNSSTDVHVVNVNDTSSHPTAATDGPIMSTGRDSITVSPLTVMPGSSSLTSSSTSSPLTKDQHKPSYDNQKEMSDRGPQAKKSQSLEQQSSTPQRGLFPVSMSPVSMSPINQVNQPKKSFAAGSASQAASMSQTNDSSSTSKRPSTSTVEIVDRPPSSDSSKELGTKSKVDDGSASNSTDMAPDLSIVKVEPTMEDPGLDMYVDVPEDSILQAQHRDQREHDDESDLELEEASGDWSRDEMSNEAGGSDQNNSWYIGQFKGRIKYEYPIQQPSDQSIQEINLFNPVETGLSSLDQIQMGHPITACKPKIKRNKVIIRNPKFWKLPMMALIGNQPEELVTNIDSFVTLQPVMEPFQIPEEAISAAMSSCMSQRHRFATTVLRHICSIGDIYIGNVSGKIFRNPPNPVNRKICPVKMDALEKICFEYFPSSSATERERDWKVVVTALHKAVWYARKYIRNLLDISFIEQDLM